MALSGIRVRAPAHFHVRWLILGLLGLLFCVGADVLMLSWIQAGPPPGKSHIFFRELAIVLAGTFIFFGLAISRPDLGRLSVPFVFLLLDWHTGMQLNWTQDQLLLVVSATDILILVLIFVGLTAQWPWTPAGRYLFGRLGKPLGLYLIFCLWGFAVAVIRGVDVSPFYGNMKTMTLYPFIALLIPICLRSWRELYWAVGFFVVCVLERTLEGLRHHGASSVAVLHTTTGQTLDRINGNYASVNQYAFYIMSGLLVLTALLVAGRRPHLRMMLGPLVGVVALAVILTYSRGAWLALAAAGATLALLVGARRIAALILVVAAAYLVVVTTQPGISHQISARINDPYGQDTIAQRQGLNTLALQVIGDYPFGAGWGASFHPTPLGLIEDHGGGMAPWYHDDYLQLATEIGVPGLAVFLWLWAAILWLGFRTLRSVRDANQRALVLGLFVAIVGMLVQAATDQFMWRSDVGPHIWIITGFLLTAAALHHLNPGTEDNTEEIERTMSPLQVSRAQSDAPPVGAAV